MKEPFYIKPLKLALQFATDELEHRVAAYEESGAADSDSAAGRSLPHSINEAQHVVDVIQSALAQSKFLYTLKKDRPR